MQDNEVQSILLMVRRDVSSARQTWSTFKRIGRTARVTIASSADAVIPGVRTVTQSNSREQDDWHLSTYLAESYLSHALEA